MKRSGKILHLKRRHTSSLPVSDPMDCSLPGSSIHDIFQARVLEWVAIAFSVLSSTIKLYSKDIALRSCCEVKYFVEIFRM